MDLILLQFLIKKKLCSNSKKARVYVSSSCPCRRRSPSFPPPGGWWPYKAINYVEKKSNIEEWSNEQLPQDHFWTWRLRSSCIYFYFASRILGCTLLHYVLKKGIPPLQRKYTICKEINIWRDWKRGEIKSNILDDYLYLSALDHPPMSQIWQFQLCNRQNNMCVLLTLLI